MIRPRSRLRAVSSDERGTAAVEFSLLLPIFCLLLVGAVDFGGVLLTKFRLNSAISAAANYAVVNSSQVSSSQGSTLASSIATILGSSSSTQSTTGTIVINNGPTATMTGAATVSGGTGSPADSCYCPTLSGSTVVWGTAATCGSTCTGSGIAGKFVSISVQQTYTPSFSNYGIVQNNSISGRAVVQSQ